MFFASNISWFFLLPFHLQTLNYCLFVKAVHPVMKKQDMSWYVSEFNCRSVGFVQIWHSGKIRMLVTGCVFAGRNCKNVNLKSKNPKSKMWIQLQISWFCSDLARLANSEARHKLCICRRTQAGQNQFPQSQSLPEYLILLSLVFSHLHFKQEKQEKGNRWL